jgi:hypothetical protein
MKAVICSNIDVNWTLRIEKISISAAERDIRLRCLNLFKQPVIIEHDGTHLAALSSTKWNKSPIILFDGFPSETGLIKQKFKEE